MAVKKQTYFPMNLIIVLSSQVNKFLEDNLSQFQFHIHMAIEHSIKSKAQRKIYKYWGNVMGSNVRTNFLECVGFFFFCCDKNL